MPQPPNSGRRTARPPAGNVASGSPQLSCRVFNVEEARTEYHKITAVDRMLEQTYRAEAQHFWFRGFRKFVRPLLIRATAGLSCPRLLDCGCGTGANLQFLREFGIPIGVDLTSRGLQFAAAGGFHRLVRATVAHLPFLTATLDVAVSFDVLYCLEDDDERRAIAEMYRVLRPGGAVIVNTAALDMLKGDHS